MHLLRQEYDYDKEKARVQESVNETPLEDLKSYFLLNFADHYAQMGGHGGVIDISSMGFGFPEFFVRFNLAQQRLERELSGQEYDALVRQARQHPLVTSVDASNR
jgi:hypothetical protein